MLSSIKSFLKRPLVFIAGSALIAGTIGFVGLNAFAKSRDSAKVVTSTCEVQECVSLVAAGATPSEIAIPVGSFVQFNSSDGKKYNLAINKEKGSLAFDHGSDGTHVEGDEHSESIDSSMFKSGDFSGDEAWRVQFSQKGTFIFKDAYNENIDIIVVAYVPGGENKIQ